MRGVLLALCLLPGLAVAGPRADALAEEAEQQYLEESYIGARTDAEEALSLDPDQYRAHYVLGMVHRDSEGNLAQAMYHLGEARRAYETRYATSLDTDWRFHQNLVFWVQAVAQEIEEYDYQLEMIDYYNARYDPDLIGEKAWPLMKLGRFDDARAAAAEARATGDDWQISVGLNALCALEAETGDRVAAYEACLAALEAERASPEGDVTVDAYNAALSAYQALRYDEGDALALEANTGSAESTANPFALIAGAALAEGRGRDAVDAIRSMQGLRARMKPEYRDMNRAELDATFATFLLAAGEPEFAYDVISRAIDFPDRRALTSGSAAQSRAGHALLRLAIRDAARERGHEVTSTAGFTERTYRALLRALPDTLEWEDSAAVVSAMSDERLLHQTLRLYLDGGLAEVPTWLVGELVEVLGTGVVGQELAVVRAAEPHEGMTPFYDALEAEVAWWNGRYDTVRELAASAARDLPPEETLLRARALALAADAAWRQGEEQTARALYADTMQADPSVIRRLGLALPATIRNASGTNLGDRAESMLGRSPRFRSDDNGFVVSITKSGGDSLQICLTSPAGARLACAVEPTQPPAPEGETLVPWTDWERARHTVDAFHRAAFALPTGLTRRELSGLDGTNTIDTQAAREEMSSLLDDLTGRGSKEE